MDFIIIPSSSHKREQTKKVQTVMIIPTQVHISSAVRNDWST